MSELVPLLAAFVYCVVLVLAMGDRPRLLAFVCCIAFASAMVNRNTVPLLMSAALLIYAGWLLRDCRDNVTMRQEGKHEREFG